MNCQRLDFERQKMIQNKWSQKEFESFKVLYFAYLFMFDVDFKFFTYSRNLHERTCECKIIEVEISLFEPPDKNLK